MSAVKTVGVFIGASRSLTTLSSAMMAFHPEVTVLNHSFARIFADPGRNFMLSPSQATLDAFVGEAQGYARGGQRGEHGGHILHSHAFDDEVLRSAYLDRYGWEAKPRATCLLWKDATRLTGFVIRNKISLDMVAGALPPLRFVSMVRNPVDIVVSSIKNGFSAALVGVERKDNFLDVFQQMMRRFASFSLLAKANPRQFRFVFQDEMAEEAKLTDLCQFLDISADTVWLGDLGRLIELRPSYPIDEARKAQLKAIAIKMIPDDYFGQRVADQIV